MKINNISPISLKANQKEKLVPLKGYSDLIHKLTPDETKQIKILREELNRLELESYDLVKTISANMHLTGHQKEMYRIKLFNINESINTIKDKIYKIKQHKYEIPTAKFLQKMK